MPSDRRVEWDRSVEHDEWEGGGGHCEGSQKPVAEPSWQEGTQLYALTPPIAEMVERGRRQELAQEIAALRSQLQDRRRTDSPDLAAKKRSVEVERGRREEVAVQNVAAQGRGREEVLEQGVAALRRQLQARSKL